MNNNELSPGELNIAVGAAGGKSKIKKSKYFFFTWETNSAQRKLPSVSELQRLLKPFTGYYAFQLERGEIKGKEHYQGCFSLASGQLTKKRLLEYISGQTNIDYFPPVESPLNIGGLTIMYQYSFKGSIDYCTKEETRIEGPWIKGEEVSNYIDVKEFKLSRWQEIVYGCMLSARHPKRKNSHLATRGIIYVEDKEGGAGKTSFIKWMSQHRKDLQVYKIPIGKPDRLISAIVKLRGKKVDAICIDIPRTLAEDVDLKGVFHAIEELKGGHLVDCMYGNYNEAFFKNLVILITSNIPYEMVTPLMSEDRWYIYRLESEKKRKRSNKKVIFIKPDLDAKNASQKSLYDFWDNQSKKG